MIKINLLKNSAGSSKLHTSMNNMSDVTLIGGAGGDEEVVDSKRILAKIFVVLIFPIALVAVDYYLTSLKQKKLDALNANIAAVQKKIASYGDKAESVRKFQEEKKSLERRIGIIKRLSSQRLLVVKTLDALHQIVPEKAWLTDFSILSGESTVVGRAADDSIVSSIIQNLDESIYFDQVRLQSSEEAKVAEGKVRKFIINSRVRN